MRQFGVYIHFPYCRNLCPYCDFAVTVAPEGAIAHTRYRDAVLRELETRAPLLEGRQLVSIYFGGGTPSLWAPECIAEVIAAVRARFAGVPREVTLEANPTDCTPANMQAWLQAGVNRLSIGVQSYDAGELVALGRDHRMGDGARALTAALAAGFQSLSADLILGAPGSGSTVESVERAADSDAPHLSVYELTIEERTVFGKRAARGELAVRDPDELADLYERTHHLLSARGYEHYEISSYARPGHRAVHNSLYWTGAEYLGLGCGAASFVRTTDGGGRRWTNARSTASYLRDPDHAVAEEIIVTPREYAEDRVWLGMRTSDGVALQRLRTFPGLADALLAAGLAEPRSGRLRPTLRGFLCADAIATRVASAAR